MNTSIEDLCCDLPTEFATYLKYVRGLGFDDQPNYSYLRKLFRNLFGREGYRYDNVFDWTIKKFFMLHNSVDKPPVRQTRRGARARRASANVASTSHSRPLSGQTIDQRETKKRKSPSGVDKGAARSLSAREAPRRSSRAQRPVSWLC